MVHKINQHAAECGTCAY